MLYRIKKKGDKEGRKARRKMSLDFAFFCLGKGKEGYHIPLRSHPVCEIIQRSKKKEEKGCLPGEESPS